MAVLRTPCAVLLWLLAQSQALLKSGSLPKVAWAATGSTLGVRCTKLGIDNPKTCGSSPICSKFARKTEHGLWCRAFCGVWACTRNLQLKPSLFSFCLCVLSAPAFSRVPRRDIKICLVLVSKQKRHVDFFETLQFMCMLLIRLRGGVEAASYTASQSQLTAVNALNNQLRTANFGVFVNPWVESRYTVATQQRLPGCTASSVNQS